MAWCRCYFTQETARLWEAEMLYAIMRMWPSRISFIVAAMPRFDSSPSYQGWQSMLDRPARYSHLQSRRSLPAQPKPPASASMSRSSGGPKANQSSINVKPPIGQAAVTFQCLHLFKGITSVAKIIVLTAEILWQASAAFMFYRGAICHFVWNMKECTFIVSIMKMSVCNKNGINVWFICIISEACATLEDHKTNVMPNGMI